MGHVGSHMWTEHGISLKLVLGGIRAAAEWIHLPEKSNSACGELRCRLLLSTYDHASGVAVSGRPLIWKLLPQGSQSSSQMRGPSSMPAGITVALRLSYHQNLQFCRMVSVEGSEPSHHATLLPLLQCCLYLYL